MEKEINPDELNKFLSDVSNAEVFFFNNGHVVRNLEELSHSLKSMKDETFTYHVNAQKDDFANWIQHALGDEELASKLERIKNRIKYQKVVQERIEEIENAVVSHHVDELEKEEKKQQETQTTNPEEAEKKKKKIEKVQIFLLGLIIGVIIGYVVSYLL